MINMFTIKAVLCTFIREARCIGYRILHPIKNNTLVIILLLINNMSINAMNQITFPLNEWYSCPLEVKTGIVAQAYVEDKENLKLVNKV
jgi:hypothetical protein